MLNIKNYTKIYAGDKKACDDVNICVEAGDIFGFIGHNGAGKSTTIRAVVGVLDFTEGEIWVDGHSVKAEPMECKRITAYIPDNPDIYENLTGIQYLNFVADAYGIGSEERSDSIKKYGDLFEITDDLGDLISSYSHGMKQKVAIIGALIHNPKLLVLDEPFVGLDPKAAHTLKEIMKELCNKIAIIRGGKIIASGITEQLLGDKSLEDVFLEVVDDVK